MIQTDAYLGILFRPSVEFSAVIDNELHILLKVLNGGVITTINLGFYVAQGHFLLDDFGVTGGDAVGHLKVHNQSK